MRSRTKFATKFSIESREKVLDTSYGSDSLDLLQQDDTESSLRARKRASKADRPVPTYDQECLVCGHAWVRHIKRYAGRHVCVAKHIDASGNWEGCGCNETPPTAAHQ